MTIRRDQPSRPAPDHRFQVVPRFCSDGDPAFVVSVGELRGEAVAHFFSQLDAQGYCDWRNERKTKTPPA